MDAAKASCEKPQAWNIGATTTVTSSARHGVRSRMAFSVWGLPPEWLAPFGVPVVPDVSRMTFDLRPDRLGWLPKCSLIILSTSALDRP